MSKLDASVIHTFMNYNKKHLQSLAWKKQVSGEAGNLSVSDLTAIFDVSRATIHNWDESGKLPAHHKIGSERRYTISQVESFLDVCVLSNREIVQKIRKMIYRLLECPTRDVICEVSDFIFDTPEMNDVEFSLVGDHLCEHTWIKTSRLEVFVAEMLPRYSPPLINLAVAVLSAKGRGAYAEHYLGMGYNYLPQWNTENYPIHRRIYLGFDSDTLEVTSAHTTSEYEMYLRMLGESNWPMLFLSNLNWFCERKADPWIEVVRTIFLSCTPIQQKEILVCLCQPHLRHLPSCGKVQEWYGQVLDESYYSRYDYRKAAYEKKWS